MFLKINVRLFRDAQNAKLGGGGGGVKMQFNYLI